MTTDTKLIRFLKERIEFCKIQDNRTSRTLYEDILHRALKGEFEEIDEDYAKDIKTAEEHGFCANCQHFSFYAINIELCSKCFKSENKCNFKPKEDKQNAND